MSKIWITSPTNPHIYSYFKIANETLEYKDIPYNVRLSINGVRHILVTWCEENCVNPWGWYFLDHVGYIGFADKSEWFMFCMSTNYTENNY
jgi:hypothetical protein